MEFLGPTHLNLRRRAPFCSTRCGLWCTARVPEYTHPTLSVYSGSGHQNDPSDSGGGGGSIGSVLACCQACRLVFFLSPPPGCLDTLVWSGADVALSLTGWQRESKQQQQQQQQREVHLGMLSAVCPRHQRMCAELRDGSKVNDPMCPLHEKQREDWPGYCRERSTAPVPVWVLSFWLTVIFHLPENTIWVRISRVTFCSTHLFKSFRNDYH